MNAQVLVAYASKYGSTKEIAEKIGRVLAEAGFAAEVLAADRGGAPAQEPPMPPRPWAEGEFRRQLRIGEAAVAAY